MGPGASASVDLKRGKELDHGALWNAPIQISSFKEVTDCIRCAGVAFSRAERVCVNFSESAAPEGNVTPLSRDLLCLRDVLHPHRES